MRCILIVVLFAASCGNAQTKLPVSINRYYLKAGVSTKHWNYASEIWDAYTNGKGATYASFDLKPLQKPFGYYFGTGKYFENTGSVLSIQVGLCVIYKKLPFEFKSPAKVDPVYTTQPYIRNIYNVEGYIEEKTIASDINFGVKIDNIRLFVGLNPTYISPSTIKTRFETETYSVTPKQVAHADSITTLLSTNSDNFSWDGPQLNNLTKTPIVVGFDQLIDINQNALVIGFKFQLVKKYVQDSKKGVMPIIQLYTGFVFGSKKQKKA